jgi:3-hydroxyacyl-[acyl-carrier-protein] dehydratase
MVTAEQKIDILSRIPHKKPFRFIDELYEITENSACGTYTYKTNEFFYKGHFPEKPITPGVILTETMAQIGLVSLGIFLLEKKHQFADILFISSDVKFLQIVYPEQKVTVESKKIYFRYNILKCEVKMLNEFNDVVCTGILCGMLLTKDKKEKII